MPVRRVPAPEAPPKRDEALKVLGSGITCLAGFYATAAQAQTARRAMTAPALGVQLAQLRLIAPTRGLLLPLWRSGQRWALRRSSADRRWFDNRGVMTGLAIAATAVALGSGLAMETNDIDMSLLFLTMLVAGVGAVAATALALLGRQQPQYKRFNQMVRQQLAARRWVLLVHDVPPQHQDAVFALVREHSHGWCVASAGQRWL